MIPAALLSVHFTSLISHKYVPSSRCPQRKLNDLHLTSLRHLSAQWIGETTRSLRNTWSQSLVFLWRLLSKVVSSMQAASIDLLNQKTETTKAKKWTHTMFIDPVYLSLANESNLFTAHWKKTRSIFLSLCTDVYDQPTFSHNDSSSYWLVQYNLRRSHFVSF